MRSLLCALIVSVFQTRVQYSIFRDRRSQLSLGKERLGTSPSSKAAPNKSQREDSNATVRSGEAHGTMVALVLCHRKVGHTGTRDG